MCPPGGPRYGPVIILKNLHVSSLKLVLHRGPPQDGDSRLVVVLERLHLSGLQGLLLLGRSLALLLRGAF